VSAAWIGEGLTVRFPGATSLALNDVTLAVQRDACTAVLGPNGSGKSTLLRVLLGVIKPATGTVRYDGKGLAEWSRGEMARSIGVVPQGEVAPFPMTARELVGMGRYPYLGPWRREGVEDIAAIERAMARCDVVQFAGRMIDTLSGGERQRVRIARALAQEPAALVLDEPTASLDLKHEMAIAELVRSLATAGTTVLFVTHNLSLAARYADRVVLMDEGRLVADGVTAEVMTAERLDAVFGWPVELVRTAGGAPSVVAR
jgi:iron complex transport system ATP-binding protein